MIKKSVKNRRTRLAHTEQLGIRHFSSFAKNARLDALLALSPSLCTNLETIEIIRPSSWSHVAGSNNYCAGLSDVISDDGGGLIARSLAIFAGSRESADRSFPRRYR